MKRLLLVLLLLTGYMPGHAQTLSVLVNFDGTDGCPQSIRVLGSAPNTRCRSPRSNGVLQADAVCVNNADIVEFTGRLAYTITKKSTAFPFAYPCTAVTSSPGRPNRIQCTVTAADTSGSYRFNIETAATTGPHPMESCVLDPRILLN